MKKYLPMIICGFGAGVLNIVPIIKSLSCCLVIPLAAILSLLLEQKANNDYTKIPVSKALKFGVLTGIFAAFFNTILSVLIIFITKTSEINESLVEFQKFLSTIPDPGIGQQVFSIMSKMADEINQYGFSFLYTFSIFSGSIIANSIFGMIGGLVGMRLLNNRIDSNH